VEKTFSPQSSGIDIVADWTSKRNSDDRAVSSPHFRTFSVTLAAGKLRDWIETDVSCPGNRHAGGGNGCAPSKERWSIFNWVW
jgi:hypothetical protein